MKRALLLALSLTAACSGSSHPAALPTTTPSPSPSPSSAATLSAPSPAVTLGSATPTEVGPAGVPVGPYLNFGPQSATFVSDRTGWVLGSGTPARPNNEQTVIVRTRDAGASWRLIATLPVPLSEVAQLRFANLRDGYLTGSQLLVTHDGGGSWRLLKGLDNAQDVEAAAGRAWVLVSGKLSSGPVGGGRFEPEPAPADTSSFVLHGTTVVVTRRGSTALYVGGHGRAFSARPTPCGDQAEPTVGLGSATRWLLVCGESAGAGQQEKSAYLSTDAGVHWTPAGSPPPLVGTTVAPTADGDFVFDHQEVAVLRGGAWRTVLTSDGGIVEGGFASAALGYAIGGFAGGTDQVMKITHDAGRTWSTVAF